MGKFDLWTKKAISAEPEFNFISVRPNFIISAVKSVHLNDDTEKYS